jgi:hypothetical protein
MNYKLKHLSKFCCKPETPEAFELVKLSAEIGCVEISKEIYPFERGKTYLTVGKEKPRLQDHYVKVGHEIPVLDFCKKLRMSEEEAEKLEDDRVEFTSVNHNVKWRWSNDDKSILALNGHYFKTNEDGTEVTLHKRD